MRKIIYSTMVAMLLLFVTALPVQAAPSNVTQLYVSASTTSVDLRWEFVTGATSYVIRYATTGFPATPAAGTSAYSGTGYYTTLTGLTSGVTYYFSAWGYDGADYSATAYNVSVTTLAASLVTGGGDTYSDLPAIQDLPADIIDSPDGSGSDFGAIGGVLNYFNTAPGGLNIPTNNLELSVLTIGIVIASIWVYTKTNSMLMGWLFCLVCQALGWWMGLMSWGGIVVIVVMGMMMWAFKGLAKES